MLPLTLEEMLDALPANRPLCKGTGGLSGHWMINSRDMEHIIFLQKDETLTEFIKRVYENEKWAGKTTEKEDNNVCT